MAAFISRNIFGFRNKPNFTNIVLTRLNSSLKSECSNNTIFRMSQLPARLKPRNQIITQSRKFKRWPDKPDQSFLSQISKPLGFTVLVGSTSLVACLIFHRISMIRWHMQRDKRVTKTENMQRAIKRWFNDNTNAYRYMIISIIASNIIVFGLWRVPALSSIMQEFFMCVNGKPVISMFLSAFSHRGLLHLTVNMYVLYNFSSLVLPAIGSKEMFAWVYINGAIVSSLTSIIFKLASKSVVPSVGASGAILALIACVCTAYPDVRLTFPIIGELTGFSFTASQGIKGMIAFDMLGLILRWKIFDHAGHLGGVLLGLWYMHYGKTIMTDLLNRYNRFLGNKNKSDNNKTVLDKSVPNKNNSDSQKPK